MSDVYCNNLECESIDTTGKCTREIIVLVDVTDTRNGILTFNSKCRFLKLKRDELNE